MCLFHLHHIQKIISIGNFCSFLFLISCFESIKKKKSGHLRYTTTRTPRYNYGPYHSSIYPHHSFAAMSSPYYHRDMEDPISPALPGHHRSRSASRPPVSHPMDYPSNLQSNSCFFRTQFNLDSCFRTLSIIRPWRICRSS